MSRRKSEIWTAFKDLPGNKAVCKLCGNKLSVANKSTFSLIRHLKSKHPTFSIERQAQDNNSDVEIDSNTNTNNNSNNERSNNNNSNNERSNTNSNNERRSNHQITSFLNRPLPLKKKQQVDRQLVKMICKEYHPFSVVEDKEFKCLLHLLNPSYSLPTRKTISNSLIPTLYNETVEHVQSQLKKGAGFCLTVDAWTSRAGDSFFGVTAHYLVEEEESLKLLSNLLGCVPFDERHTGDNIAKRLTDLCGEWNISNEIVGVISDNAPNMTSAIRKIGWDHWGCFAHSLNLVVQSSLNKIETVLEKVKKIVRFFKKSSHGQAKLSSTQESMGNPKLKLINDVPTRWNSTFEMLERFFVLKNSLTATLALLQSNMLSVDSETGDLILLTSNEWLMIEQSVKVLEIFKVITDLISSEKYVTASVILLFIKQIRKQLLAFNRNDFLFNIRNLISELLYQLNERFMGAEMNDLIATATLLDPRFKKFGFSCEEFYDLAVQSLISKAEEIIIPAAENQVNQSNNNDKSPTKDIFDIIFEEIDAEAELDLVVSNQRSSGAIEVDKYLAESILPRRNSGGQSQDPLIWWYERKHVYPRLYKLAKKYLAVSATSVPCERIFSHAGQIVNDRRQNMIPEKTTKVVFLNYNL